MCALAPVSSERTRQILALSNPGTNWPEKHSSGDMNGGAATKPLESEPLQAHMLHNKTAQSHAPPPHPDDLDAPSQDPSLLVWCVGVSA